MSSYVFMKVLERIPTTYDRGMRLLSRGRLAEVYQQIAQAVAGEGRVVLDIGCGTGQVSLACAQGGAQVEAIDPNPGMLEVAQKNIEAFGMSDRIRLHELSAAEIEDNWPEAHFDAVVSSLALSEMSEDEQRYCLRIAASRLKPGGAIAIADEVQPTGLLQRVAHASLRLPLAAATRLMARSSTRPIHDLQELVRGAGFAEITRVDLGANLSLVTARRPAGATS